MASCGRLKTDDTKKDLISELPANVKDRILECLSTIDAARTAILSTHWRDVWLGHGRLVFDSDFMRYVRFSVRYFMKTISYILYQRTGPVKKFTLIITRYLGKQCDVNPWLDQLFRSLSRNGIEELSISVYIYKYKLPSCIVSCPTIKKLALKFVIFDWPINARCIFPAATSLVFDCVQFNDMNGIVTCIPNLEKLVFKECKGISDLEINTPKLESLFVIDVEYAVVESRWFTHYLKTIKTLCLSGHSMSDKDVALASLAFPTAFSLQVIKFYELCFDDGNQLTIAMQLLKKSPNLCELDILASVSTCSPYDVKAASKLLEDPNSCIINQDLKRLNTLKIESFMGSTVEMLFVKMLLSKSPALERVVIPEGDVSMKNKIRRELMGFPRCIHESTYYLHGVFSYL